MLAWVLHKIPQGLSVSMPEDTHRPPQPLYEYTGLHKHTFMLGTQGQPQVATNKLLYK